MKEITRNFYTIEDFKTIMKRSKLDPNCLNYSRFSESKWEKMVSFDLITRYGTMWHIATCEIAFCENNELYFDEENFMQFTRKIDDVARSLRNFFLA